MKINKFLAGSLLAVAILTGCSDSETTQDNNSNITKEEAVFEAFTFTDMDGHEVTISEPVETVYITGMTPLPAVYALYNGTEGLVSIPADSINLIKGTVFENVVPELMNIPTNSELNIEEILSVNPDVVFYTGGNEDTYNTLTNAGLTAVAFSTAMTQDSNAIENANKWVEQLATVFQDEQNSKNLVDYNAEVLEKISTKSQAIADTDKPSALFIFALADNTLTVAGGGHYSDFWITNSGAINAASELSKIQPVSIEQLMEWNPDKIFITNFNKATVENVLNNEIAGFDFSQLKAVQNSEVYKVPLGSYRWYAPSNEGALMLQWMATINQPEVFSDINIQEEISAFYSKFYKHDLTATELEQMLHVTK